MFPHKSENYKTELDAFNDALAGIKDERGVLEWLRFMDHLVRDGEAKIQAMRHKLARIQAFFGGKAPPRIPEFPLVLAMFGVKAPPQIPETMMGA